MEELIKDIKEEIKLFNIGNKPLAFECFSDGGLTFSYTSLNNTTFQITVITTDGIVDATFFSLLELNLSFLDFAVFINDEKISYKYATK